jgi:hypothetical protein
MNFEAAKVPQKKHFRNENFYDCLAGGYRPEKWEEQAQPLNINLIPLRKLL